LKWAGDGLLRSISAGRLLHRRPGTDRPFAETRQPWSQLR